ncbi:hypothetical protein PV328_009638 [Microctonus aethiopoides]|uniref:Odorant receptor n=1 Tax=Microctonus aethiopoides TaxID=144406 RepID=A0AA39C693_9HYME|nr:hypothetical protein PV328_009638 [Microctonus aethiopoides]
MLSGAITNFISKIIINRIHRGKFQKIDSELYEFLRSANEDEIAVLQKYVDKCWKFHGIMTCSFYLAAIGMITGPLYLPQKFPSDAIYPFPVDSMISSTIVHLHHCIVGFQCSAALALDYQAALFLWYICARFEIIFKQIENIKNYKDFRSFIKTHQDILRSGQELLQPVRLIFFTTICMSKIITVFSAIILISNQPMAVKIQFIMVLMSMVISIFMCVWPAEELMNISSDLLMLNIFYASSTHPPAIRKMWLIVTRRAQTPITIEINGFMDTLSFDYYSVKIDLELNEFLRNANEYEMAVLQKYVDKCWKFHGCMTCSFYLTSLGVIIGPLFLPQKFPSDAIYPFPVDSMISSTIVHLHHCIVAFQCSAALALDYQAALFLWYICARFEIIFKQIENIKNFEDFRSCIKTHQDILRSSQELVQPVRLIFFTRICMSKIVINQPMAVKLQFIMVLMTMAISIFVCVWPAEKLINVSGNLMTLKIFYALSNHPPAIRKMWLNVIRRAQTLIIIKIDGFMDELSFKFYSTNIDLELNEFLRSANKYEMAVLQKYVDKCWKFHGSMTCGFYLTTIGVMIGPLFLPQKFPCDAIYPFPVDSMIVSTIVYLHQSIVGLQCSAALALDYQAALFLWYICARFELIFKQIENIKNFEDFRSCVKSHQSILSSSQELIQPVRLIFLTRICMSKIAIVFSVIILISNQPTAVKLQFIIMLVTLAISILVCVWPAEKLKNVSGNLLMLNIFYASSAHPPAIRKMWLNVIRRAQTPITIKIDGFMDALSFEFYSAFLSTIFSYITVLRVVFQT